MSKLSKKSNAINKSLKRQLIKYDLNKIEEFIIQFFNIFKKKLYDYKIVEDLNNKDEVCYNIISNIIKYSIYSKKLALNLYLYSNQKDYIRYCNDKKLKIYVDYSNNDIEKFDFLQAHILLIAGLFIVAENYNPYISDNGLINIFTEGLKRSPLWDLALKFNNYNM